MSLQRISATKSGVRALCHGDSLDDSLLLSCGKAAEAHKAFPDVISLSRAVTLPVRVLGLLVIVVIVLLTEAGGF